MTDQATASGPTSSIDEIIELYKQDLDLTLIDENLKLTPEQRFLKFINFMHFVEGVREAGRRHRGEA